MNKKQKLIEYIQGEIPEIMELKFGCKIIKGISDQFGCGEDKTIYTIYKTAGFQCFVLENNHNNNQYIRGELAEIIGRPITLSDVLRVIKMPYTIHNVIRDFSKILIICNSTRAEFDLKKDFNNQSPELYDFLHQLLIENK